MSINYIQTTEYTVVVSPLTGNTLFRNDSPDKYLLASNYSLAKVRTICNRVILGWSVEEYWSSIEGTEYEVACMALVKLRNKQSFVDGFNSLIAAINLGGDRDNKLMIKTGLRRRFVELVSALWESQIIAAPSCLPFDHRTQLGLGTIKLGRELAWIYEVAEASNSRVSSYRQRSSYLVWRLAMTAIGIREVGDITPDSICKKVISGARGKVICAIRPLLAIQKKTYASQMNMTEHDWGLGRGKPRPVFDFSSILQDNPPLDEWLTLLTNWLTNDVSGGVAPKRDAVTVFCRYLIACPRVTRNPLEFVSRTYFIPLRFEEWLDQQHLDQGTIAKRINRIASFFDWYVDVRLAFEDDYGRPVRNPQFFNPVTHRSESVKRSETAREALPIRYLRELIYIISHDDYAWAKSISEDQIKRFNPITKQWEKIWCPIRAYAMLIKLYLPLRTYQVSMLDSGEADTNVLSGTQWIKNESDLAPEGKSLIQRGFLRRYCDQNTSSTFTGFYVNTNKTADRFKDLNDKGYEIPWQHDEVIRLVSELKEWQSTFNPINQPTKWVELNHLNVIRSHTKAQLIARGSSCFLFRDPIRSSKDHPINTGRLSAYWYKLLDELERRVAGRGENLSNGQAIKFIEKRNKFGLPMVPVFDLHSLRVSILTALSKEGGVPLSILSKCVAGHAGVLMTLYYLKQGPSYISQQLAEAQAKMLEKEQENYLRFLQDTDLAQAESVVAFNDLAGLRAVHGRTSAGWVIGDLGICPVGGSLCHVGGAKLTGENGRNDYQPTDGGPRNCIRCRFFLSGPAFLGGLVSHFNTIGIEVMEASEKMRKMQDDINAIENEMFRDTTTKSVSYRRLDVLYARRETAMSQLDEFANNWHATYTMIERAKSILAMPVTKTESGCSVRLLTTGSLTDIATALQESSPFNLYNSVCQGATVYPAKTVPLATLRRGRFLDAMLARNQRQPIFSSLTDEEALIVGNELVNFLYARLGHFEAAQLIEGKRMLQSAGISDDMDTLLTECTGMPVRLSSLIQHNTIDDSPKLGMKEG
jgi:hypothetical protein